MNLFLFKCPKCLQGRTYNIAKKSKSSLIIQIIEVRVSLIVIEKFIKVKYNLNDKKS